MATGGRDGLLSVCNVDVFVSCAEGVVCVSSIPFFPKDDGDRVLQQRKVTFESWLLSCQLIDWTGRRASRRPN